MVESNIFLFSVFLSSHIEFYILSFKYCDKDIFRHAPSSNMYFSFTLSQKLVEILPPNEELKPKQHTENGNQHRKEKEGKKEALF